MQSVRDDFDTRSKEIDGYFAFVKTAISANSELALVDDAGNQVSLRISNDLQKTLKATGFLLLYNMVESTMRNAIEAIIEHLRDQSVSFDDLTSNVKIVILTSLKRWNPDKIEPNLKIITNDIIDRTFKKDELFSGNLDARKIRETMNEYGVSQAVTVNGDCLLTIKNKRNDLAHGVVSFSDCGKDYDIEDLIAFKGRANDYLQEVLDNIERFLSNGDYIQK